MTTKHDIIWINNKDWSHPWMYLLGQDYLITSNFWKKYFWYILYTVLWGMLFYISKYINHFNKTQISVMYYGYGIGLMLIYGVDFFYHNISTRYIDEKTNQVYRTTVTNDAETDYILDEDKDNILKIKNFKSYDSYAFQSDYIKKLVTEGKIKVKQDSNAIDNLQNMTQEQKILYFKDLDTFWELLTNHRNVTLITLLSLAYVIAYWNFHKLRKIFPWISVIFALILLLQGYWMTVPHKDIYQYINVIFFFRKTQEIITALSIISVLIYINL